MIIDKPLDIDNKKIVYDGCMLTVSGTIINLFDPKEDDILIQDIAHGLAYTCRWNGATKSYFSVAEHCCMMFDKVPDELKATALFHDAEEAYWGDIIKPLKNLLPADIRHAMEQFRNAIFNKFGVPPINEDIERADFELLQWDFEHLIKEKKHKGMGCDVAKVEFITRYQKLQKLGFVK